MNLQGRGACSRAVTERQTHGNACVYIYIRAPAGASSGESRGVTSHSHLISHINSFAIDLTSRVVAKLASE